VEGLLRRGIIIRPLQSFGLPNCVRISTGTDEQMETCVEAFQSVLPALSR
jgi:histidinol-phosphate aminotransferase